MVVWSTHYETMYFAVNLINISLYWSFVVLDRLGAIYNLTLRDPCLGRDPYFGNHWQTPFTTVVLWHQQPGSVAAIIIFQRIIIFQLIVLIVTYNCALHCNKDKFSVLARARTSFHLSALEATFIKSLNPLLCKQKEFVCSLKIS